MRGAGLVFKAAACFLFLHSAVSAASDKEIERFIAQSFERNPNFVFKSFKVDKREAVKGLKGWDKVDFTIRAAPKGQTETMSQSGSLYSSGDFFAEKLISSGSLSASGEALNKAVADSLRENTRLSLESSKVTKRIKMKEPAGFEAAIIELDIDVKDGERSRKISTTEIWFASGGYLTPNIYRFSSGSSLKDSVKGDVTGEHYRDDRIIAGNAEGKAKYKIIVFSDPLCPACRATMPRLIEAADKNPSEISLYYYSLPTHAVSPTLMKAAIARHLGGAKNAERELYEKNLTAQTADDLEALEIFNETFGSKLTLQEINARPVLEIYNIDAKTSLELAVNSTPSVFINGRYDASRAELQKILEKLK